MARPPACCCRQCCARWRDRRHAAAGNAAPAGDIAHWLQRSPRAHSDFITPADAEPLRQRAWLRWMAPMLRLSIAFVWIWTFVVSIGLYPRAQSLDLLAQVGAHGA